MTIKWKYVFRAAVSVFIFALLFGYYYSDKFYPHTFINGVSVSGLTYAQGEKKIVSFFEDIKTNGFNLEFARETNTRKVNIPSFASGFTPDTVVEYFTIGDIEKSFSDAYGRGREASFWDRWLGRLSSLFWDKTYEVPFAIQREAVVSLLDRELNGFLSGPKNAEFVWDKGKIAISEGRNGADVDYDKILDGMKDALNRADKSSLWFGVNLISPRITSTNLKLRLEFVNDLINKPVNIEFWNGPYWWRARGAVIADWITLNENNKEKIEIKPEKLRNFFELNVDYPPIEEKSLNARFEMQNGKLVQIVPGKPGLEVNFDKLKADTESQLQTVYENYLAGKIKAQTLNVNFTVEKVQPQINKETIDKYKITDLIGRAQTSFLGSSAARINNIKVGVSKLNGILLAPGEEFSAVKAIGEVTEEAGYQKEFVIKVDKSVEEYGGGLCQVGTTLFRLALDAGLPVTERQNHSYVVGYYGPGLDATIYGPYPDLKFVNDTGNYILLQGMVEGTNLIFEFYGKKDGRHVTISDVRIKDKISPPDTKYILSPDLLAGQKKCTEKRRDGLTAEADYTVEYANGDVSRQTFTSIYKSWQEVCLLGTGI